MFPPVYNSAKIIKNPSKFSRVMVTNVLPPFYGSQCTLFSSNNTVSSSTRLTASHAQIG